MTRFVRSRLKPGRPLLTAAVVLAVLATAMWLSVACRAQVPVNPDLEGKSGLVLFDGKTEVGRVYRDAAGDTYTEHWVLYPNYRFDQTTRAGGSIQIAVVTGEGYSSLGDFLDHVPFPKGSRYVIARCMEFDELP